MKILATVFALVFVIGSFPMVIGWEGPDETDEPKPPGDFDVTASYIIYQTNGNILAKNVLSNAIEHNGTNATSIIQQTIDGCRGGIVLLKSSFDPYIIDSRIYIRDGTVLLGESKQHTIIRAVEKGGLFAIGVSDFKLGNFRLEGEACIKMAAENLPVRNVHMHDISLSVGTAYYAAFILEANTGAVENVTIERCESINSGTSGFLLNTHNFKMPIQNVTFRDCRAIGNGKYERHNPWSVGFDIAETNTASNILITGCYASDNYESGFHTEFQPVKESVRFVNCVSEHNGLDKPNAMFGAGYVVAGGVMLENCISRDNKRGFLSCNNAGSLIMRNCVDYNSIDSFDIEGRDGRMIMTDCKSYEATRHALRILGAGNITAQSLLIYYPGMENVTTGTIIGSSAHLVDNITLDVLVYGNRSSTFYCANLRDSVISGMFEISARCGIDILNPFNVVFQRSTIKVHNNTYAIHIYSNIEESTLRIYSTNIIPATYNGDINYGVVNNVESLGRVYVAQDVLGTNVTVPFFNCSPLGEVAETNYSSRMT